MVIDCGGQWMCALKRRINLLILHNQTAFFPKEKKSIFILKSIFETISICSFPIVVNGFDEWKFDRKTNEYISDFIGQWSF